MASKGKPRKAAPAPDVEKQPEDIDMAALGRITRKVVKYRPRPSVRRK